MPKATKQPSGNWKVRAYDYTDSEGKKHMRSFTASTKKEAEYMAAQFYVDKKPYCSTAEMTLSQAFDHPKATQGIENLQYRRSL